MKAIINGVSIEGTTLEVFDFIKLNEEPTIKEVSLKKNDFKINPSVRPRHYRKRRNLYHWSNKERKELAQYATIYHTLSMKERRRYVARFAKEHNRTHKSVLAEFYRIKRRLRE